MRQFKRRINPVFFLAVTLFLLQIEARVNFIHIPKCSGTTIHALLEKNFAVHEIYPERRVVNYNIMGRSKRLPKEVGLENSPPIFHEFISGHFPFWFFENMDDSLEDSFTFTVLRDPIERYNSHYRYWRQSSSNKPFEAFVCNNWICRMLSSDPQLEGIDLLENAKKNLDKLDMILFLDDSEEFERGIKNLFSRLQLPFHEKKIPRLNSTKKEVPSSEILESIYQENDLDIELYRYARDQYQESDQVYEQEYPVLSKLLEPSTHIYYSFDLPKNGSGWYRRENTDSKLPVYEHIRGGEGKITFYVKPGIDYLLQFQLKKVAKDIQFTVEVNGKKISPIRRNGKEFSLYSAKIPSGVVDKKELNITFRADKSISARMLSPTTIDTRNLSLALNRIYITPFGEKKNKHK